jgi:hypothetical protein
VCGIIVEGASNGGVSGAVLPQKSIGEMARKAPMAAGTLSHVRDVIAQVSTPKRGIMIRILAVSLRS